MVNLDIYLYTLTNIDYILVGDGRVVGHGKGT